jgi:hypothetical protein
MRAELSVELRGDLTIEEENFLRSQIDEKMQKTKSLQKYVFVNNYYVSSILYIVSCYMNYTLTLLYMT